MLRHASAASRSNRIPAAIAPFDSRIRKNPTILSPARTGICTPKLGTLMNNPV
jgi:hypothetical protein